MTLEEQLLEERLVAAHWKEHADALLDNLTEAQTRISDLDKVAYAATCQLAEAEVRNRALKVHIAALKAENARLLRQAAALDGHGQERRESRLTCFDCDAPYGEDGWCDVILPDQVWAEISPKPGGGGVLCLRCMTRRLEARGIENVHAYIMSGPYHPIGSVKRHEAMECVCKAAHAWLYDTSGKYDLVEQELRDAVSALAALRQGLKNTP